MKEIIEKEVTEKEIIEKEIIEKEIIEKKKSQLADIWRRFRKNKVAMAGLIIVLFVLAVAVFADLISDFDLAIGQDAKSILQPPSLKHLFGTDAYGRDVLAKIIFGARVSITIGFVATLIPLIIGGFIGAVSGYYGGKIDDIIMRIMDMFMSIPGLLLCLAIAAALGPGVRNMIIALTISSIPGFVRIVRSVVITVSGDEFIEAARACGTGDLRIIFVHVLPNSMGPVIVNATMSIAFAILVGAGLSYIGMGVQPPNPEWGAMLSEANNYMRQYPYLVIFPGLALVITSLAFNLLGDGLRDALDPKLKN